MRHAGDWPPLGTLTLTGTGFGTTKSGNTISALARGKDAGTLWAGTGAGRVLISRTERRQPGERHVHADRHGAQPNRAVSSIYADPTNPNHAIVTFSGYDVEHAGTPGHVFDVVVRPGHRHATWTDISYDIGDQPINDAVLDAGPATSSSRPTSPSSC